ncbi:hypothetical protein MKX54_14220 [Alkalihalobacillus sp. FSL R5-0424]
MVIIKNLLFTIPGIQILLTVLLLIVDTIIFYGAIAGVPLKVN